MELHSIFSSLYVVLETTWAFSTLYMHPTLSESLGPFEVLLDLCALHL